MSWTHERIVHTFHGYTNGNFTPVMDTQIVGYESSTFWLPQETGKYSL